MNKNLGYRTRVYGESTHNKKYEGICIYAIKTQELCSIFEESSCDRTELYSFKNVLYCRNRPKNFISLLCVYYNERMRLCACVS